MELRKHLPETGISFVDFASVLKSVTEIEAYKDPFIGSDPSFGYANRDGKIIDIIERNKLDRLIKWLSANRNNEIIILYNAGSFYS